MSDRELQNLFLLCFTPLKETFDNLAFVGGDSLEPQFNFKNLVGNIVVLQTFNRCLGVSKNSRLSLNSLARLDETFVGETFGIKLGGKFSANRQK